MSKVNYQLIRSARRKTIALQVKQAKIIVRAPIHVNVAYIEQFLAEKASWLHSKVEQQKRVLAQTNLENNKPFTESSIYINGEPHQIEINFNQHDDEHTRIRHDVDNKKLSLDLTQQYQSLNLYSNNVQNMVKYFVEQWLQASSLDYLKDRLQIYCQLTDLTPTSYKVKKYKSRWGSCNSKKELSFNSLLKMTPHWVFDYVIVHELCHLKYMDHSSQFWQLVQKYCPEYLLAKQWLKKHQMYLQW